MWTSPHPSPCSHKGIQTGAHIKLCSLGDTPPLVSLCVAFNPWAWEKGNIPAHGPTRKVKARS